MRHMRNASVLASVLTALVSYGCAPASTAPTAGGAPAAVTVTPEMINQGRTLYAGPGRCGVCHGAAARGGSLGPNLTDNQYIWIQPNQPIHNQLFNIIKNGIPEPRQFPAPMPAMGGGNLTDEQIHALAAFVASLGSS